MGGLRGTDENVFRILQHGWQAVLKERMVKEVDIVSLQDFPLQQVCHNDEEVSGEKVPLSKAIFAVDPVPKDTIEWNCHFSEGRSV